MMKFSVICDTHNLHERIIEPKGIDLFIHCGDFCDKGDHYEVIDFLDWFSVLKAPTAFSYPGITMCGGKLTKNNLKRNAGNGDHPFAS